MKRALLLAVILIGIGFASITSTQAGTKALQYAEAGESIKIVPEGLTYSGSTSYYVMELIGTTGRIEVMIPINSETGNVEIGDAVKDVLKTHYLANFFATDDAMGDFLDTTLSYAQGRYFSSAISQLELYENQLPSGVTLVNLQPLKDSITAANAMNDELRNKILAAQEFTTSTKTVWRTTDVDSTKTAFDQVFEKENAFIAALDDVAAIANDFMIELAGSELKTENPSLVQAFQGVITSNRLADGASTRTKDDLTQNKNTINAFFSGLSAKSDDYLTKLRQRYENHISPTDIQQISDKLSEYAVNYSYINSNNVYLPSSYQSQASDLHDVLTEAQNYFTNKNYTEAKAKFDEIDNLVETLMAQINLCQTPCTGGKTHVDCVCKCPSDTKEEGGKCVSSGFSLNLPLIGGLILIMVLLIVFKYKDKIFPGGGEVEEMPKDAWSNYKF